MKHLLVPYTRFCSSVASSMGLLARKLPLWKITIRADQHCERTEEFPRSFLFIFVYIHRSFFFFRKKNDGWLSVNRRLLETLFETCIMDVSNNFFSSRLKKHCIKNNKKLQNDQKTKKMERPVERSKLVVERSISIGSIGCSLRQLFR